MLGFLLNWINSTKKGNPGSTHTPYGQQPPNRSHPVNNRTPPWETTQAKSEALVLWADIQEGKNPNNSALYNYHGVIPSAEQKRKHKKNKKRIKKFPSVASKSFYSSVQPIPDLEMNNFDSFYSVPSDPQHEKSIRAEIMDSFLRASHGDLAVFSPLHQAALLRDPIFYGHLAGWYCEKGAVRDHKELFIAHLFTSSFPEHREQAMVLMQTLRTYQVARIIRYTKENLKYPTRMLKNAVKFYLRRIENQPLWFDECVIRNKHDLKYIYTTLHIKPGERAQKVLFENNPPPESRVAVVKKLHLLSEDPHEQAVLILMHKIHFTTAIGSIKHFTPGVLYSFASVMTPAQVINNLKFFENRGALTNQLTREIIQEKLKYGITESRVSDFKSRVALSKIKADADLAKELMEITNQRLKNRGRIKVPTAIFVDKSGSMEKCIQIGKLMACLCSVIAERELYVYAFDDSSFEIKAKNNDFASWEYAFSPVRADGCTSIGAPFFKLMNKEVEQILIISDGEENTQPLFADMLKKYQYRHKKKCRVFFLKVQSRITTPLEKTMQGEDFTVITFDGDYYNLPNLVPMLVSGNRFQLVEEILNTPLKSKEDLANLPPGFNEETFEIL